MENSHPLSFKLFDVNRKSYVYTTEQTLAALTACEDKMSEVDDALQNLNAVWLEGLSSEKYRVMLKRNTSIVKDTMSKVWKLANIMRTNITSRPS
jgi:hypothetical protein